VTQDAPLMDKRTDCPKAQQHCLQVTALATYYHAVA